MISTNLRACAWSPCDGVHMTVHDRAAIRSAVRRLLEALASRAPGHAVELRVPPYFAVQLIEGPRHTRGTPGAVVEMDADTLFALAEGSTAWDDAVGAGRIRASGERSDLRSLFPCVDVADGHTHLSSHAPDGQSRESAGM